MVRGPTIRRRPALRGPAHVVLADERLGGRGVAAAARRGGRRRRGAPRTSQRSMPSAEPRGGNRRRRRWLRRARQRPATGAGRRSTGRRRGGAGGTGGAAARPQLVGEALHVQQVARRDVVRGDVAAETAAAQGHRRIEAGRQADRAVRGRRVHADPDRPACAVRTRGSPGRSASGSTWCGRCRRSAGSGCTARSPRASRRPRSRRAPDRASRSTADGRGRRRPARRAARACPPAP